MSPSRSRLRPWRIAVLLGLAALGVIAVSLARPAGFLVVRDVKGQRELLRTRVTPGDPFVLDYTHSSERIPVSARFVVDANWQLAIEETAFASFGPGLPGLQEGESYEITGGMIRARHTGRVLGELSVFVHPFTGHRLRVGSRTVELSRQVAAGGLVKIRVERATPMRALLGPWLTRGRRAP